MARYSLNLPSQLKSAAEDWAARQGVSLNQFILWAVSEKVGALEQQLDDPQFPHISYRRGASGHPTPVIRGTGIRVQTIAVARQNWGMDVATIAAEYDLHLAQVKEALAFYDAHRGELDAWMMVEASMAEEAHG